WTPHLNAELNVVSSRSTILRPSQPSFAWATLKSLYSSKVSWDTSGCGILSKYGRRVLRKRVSGWAAFSSSVCHFRLPRRSGYPSSSYLCSTWADRTTGTGFDPPETPLLAGCACGGDADAGAADAGGGVAAPANVPGAGA